MRDRRKEGESAQASAGEGREVGEQERGRGYGW